MLLDRKDSVCVSAPLSVCLSLSGFLSLFLSVCLSVCLSPPPPSLSLSHSRPICIYDHLCVLSVCSCFFECVSASVSMPPPPPPYQSAYLFLSLPPTLALFSLSVCLSLPCPALSLSLSLSLSHIYVCRNNLPSVPYQYTVKAMWCLCLSQGLIYNTTAITCYCM